MKRELAYFLDLTGLAAAALKGANESIGTAGLQGVVTGADSNCSRHK